MIELFKSSVSLQVFLLISSVIERGEAKFAIVDLSVSHCSFISFCFMGFKVRLLHTHTHTHVWHCCLLTHARLRCRAATPFSLGNMFHSDINPVSCSHWLLLVWLLCVWSFTSAFCTQSITLLFLIKICIFLNSALTYC